MCFHGTAVALIQHPVASILISTVSAFAAAGLSGVCSGFDSCIQCSIVLSTEKDLFGTGLGPSGFQRFSCLLLLQGNKTRQ